MPFSVLLTDDAARDLEDLFDYIDLHDGSGRAEYVLEQIEKTFNSLSENPFRGASPGNCFPWESGSTVRFFSNPIASSIGSWTTTSMYS